MQAYDSNNKYSLLNIKIKYNWFLIISFMLSLIIITLSICIKTYDSYKYFGLYFDKQIILNIKSSDINNVLKSDYLIIDDKKIKFSIQSVGELQYDDVTLTNYQEVILSTSDNFIDNSYLEVTFYNNKQRIITKVINLLK